VVTVDVARGEIWWADLPEPRHLEPGLRRPVLIIQADRFNRSKLHTVTVAVITSNLDLADAPGNLLLPAQTTGLPGDSVINLSQLRTLDREFLMEYVGFLSSRVQALVDEGLRLALDW
jgi:mRNA interferase MazF